MSTEDEPLRAMLKRLGVKPDDASDLAMVLMVRYETPEMALTTIIALMATMHHLSDAKARAKIVQLLADALAYMRGEA